VQEGKLERLQPSEESTNKELEEIGLKVASYLPHIVLGDAESGAMKKVPCPRITKRTIRPHEKKPSPFLVGDIETVLTGGIGDDDKDSHVAYACGADIRLLGRGKNLRRRISIRSTPTTLKRSTS
jgi:hypothetical protein